MARKRISMRKIKEVLRLKFEVGLPYEEIAQGCNIGSTTVGEYLRRAKDAGLVWPLSEDMDDSSLEKLLYPRSPGLAINRPVPGWGYVHKELKRKKMLPFFCCGRNTKRPTLMVMSIAGSAGITKNGPVNKSVLCLGVGPG